MSVGGTMDRIGTSAELVARFVEHVKGEHSGDGNSRGGGRSGACAMLRLGLGLAVPENALRLGRAAEQRLASELGTEHQG